MVKGLMITNCEELPNAYGSSSEDSDVPNLRRQPDSNSRGEQAKRRKSKERLTTQRRRNRRQEPGERLYRYDALPPGNWTRVLHLFAAGNQGDPLVGYLQQGDLKQKRQERPGPDEPEPLPKFDALSWCWGDGDATEVLLLQDKDGRHQSKFKIPPTLAKALRALRHKDKRRTLWVDAICFNNKDPKEQAHQVAQMNLVYSRASSVCVWLDDDPKVGGKYGYTTQSVFEFIEKQLLDISSFDTVVSSAANARLLASVAQLMTRPWFSRRWIIQEIALTRKATIHCGSASMKWQDFAYAVSLFVKAEKSNHQLSKIVSQEKVWTKQGVFWDVQRMGAVSLVEVTTSNFFHSAKGLPEPKASLESLMAMLPMCEASKGRDVIYALLAIAKDTTPEAEGSRNGGMDLHKLYQFVRKFPSQAEQMQKMRVAQKVAAMLAAGLRSKTYTVSYTQPTIDVYKAFVEFCIFQSRSLDVLCRPWAQKPGPKDELPKPTTDAEPDTLSVHSESSSESEESEVEDDDQGPAAPADWLNEAQHEFGGFHTIGSPALATTSHEDGDANATDGADENPAPAAQRRPRGRTTRQPQAQGDMPSWIADRKNLAFTLSLDEVNRMERKNGDPLVGLPENKPYQASGTRQVRMGRIKFLRRSEYDQSLFVEGFVLGKVSETIAPGSLGTIPDGWFTFTGWDPKSKRSAPLDLYRTLIADRGPDGTKSPLTYMPAYYEIMKNTDRPLDIREKINEGKSVITEFLERVRQVTFNRQLVKVVTTMKPRDVPIREKQKLGLAPGGTERDDLVCIIYGLSVPVILRKHALKTPEQKGEDAAAQAEELPEAMRKAVRTIERYWRFWQDMKAAVLCTKYEWPRYEDRREKWGKDIRAQFSKYWLDKVEADWAVNQASRQETARVTALEAETEPRETNIWRSGTDNASLRNGIQHQISFLPRAKTLSWPEDTTQEVKDAEKWDAMCTEWKEWLAAYRDNGIEYPGRCPNMEDKEIEATTDTPNEYYKLIGEAYVDQMMDGEALAYKAEEDINDQLFELR